MKLSKSQVLSGRKWFLMLGRAVAVALLMLAGAAAFLCLVYALWRNSCLGAVPRVTSDLLEVGVGLSIVYSVGLSAGMATWVLPLTFRKTTGLLRITLMILGVLVAVFALALASIIADFWSSTSLY